MERSIRGWRALVLAVAVGCGRAPQRDEIDRSPDAAVPRPAHVVVVIEENRSFGEVVGNPQAPYIDRLAREGALFTHAFAETHPSQPNYLALFSGSTHAVADDRPCGPFDAPNLGAQLLAAGYGFAGYSESMPKVGFRGTEAGAYKRKHNPWSDFAGLPPGTNRPFDDFPADFGKLPTVAFVVPDVAHDMHSGTVAAADEWLRTRIDPYVRWSRANAGLLVLTWDEDDGSSGNRIATIFVGPMVRPGRYDGRIDHYCVLRTIEAMYGLPRIDAAERARLIDEAWTTPR